MAVIKVRKRKLATVLVSALFVFVDDQMRLSLKTTSATDDDDACKVKTYE
jgi:hypothetical protein